MTCCASALPAEITAGLDFRATVDLPDYPATEWTLAAFIRGARNIDLISTTDGATHVLAADATATSG
ncbi:hypothetical protein, partial [Klebsiella pneumoniae]|uniref:hypothetical protein n=1 Tax=Klebsiella pneumoniae TaxID=573 RepID=UPI001E29A3BE